MSESLRDAAIGVLLTADADAKAEAAIILYERWLTGAIDCRAKGKSMPDRPARPARPLLLLPRDMPKRGKGGSARARFALLHALTHIELNAIDLAIDMAGRFGPEMPPEFAQDWLKVAAEEARHFQMLQLLLAEAGGRYGDLPAHDGMWESAQLTSHDLAARLAVVPQVLEARGLDVTPAMIERFRSAEDHAAAHILEVILRDEISHVETGNRWFRRLCNESQTDPIGYFRELVTRHFRGPVKPPFNDSARRQAGLTTDWYSSLGTGANVTKP